MTDAVFYGESPDLSRITHEQEDEYLDLLEFPAVMEVCRSGWWERIPSLSPGDVSHSVSSGCWMSVQIFSTHREAMGLLRAVIAERRSLGLMPFLVRGIGNQSKRREFQTNCLKSQHKSRPFRLESLDVNELVPGYKYWHEDDFARLGIDQRRPHSVDGTVASE